ncbi:response regulator receiver modulated serine phosphatase [Thalassoporum mexicanum PCC 7367]|uniref:PP2C family protein-serine/threonine phosphatase n=1 Tax=Thalassoporum mexicanum TaxID=3457544 RepID=UPI00029FC955|nr:SpoIIE family protein phosphatase [Pseudanabaena sp. PCC 7367]AFY68499.1 response regulator receiver modulated serine phosphatase [Pseudanabaena sp. PCC 7367]
MSLILIIDDDPTMRLTLSRLLKKQGHSVATATDGEAGLIQVKEIQPSLIVCDWMMPGMDGLEVCRRLKSDPELANTYFILLTAKDQIGDIVQGLESGADDFLSKPPNMNELRARVSAGLRVYDATHALQVQKQLLEAELAEAAEYVRSLLPANLAGEIKAESCFLPSTQLGGDCFDIYWLDDEHLVFYLLDVAGHGVGAALLSVSVLNLLRTRNLRKNAQLGSTDFRQPNEVLAALNNIFQMSNHKDMYFTIWYGVYNRSTRLLNFASGGHPPAVLVDPNSSSKATRLRTSGLPIGMINDIDFESATYKVAPNSRLFLFSDGAYEITMKEDIIWGIDSFIRTLVNSCPETDGSSLDGVLAKIKQTNGHGSHFDDDLSLLEVRFD